MIFMASLLGASKIQAQQQYEVEVIMGQLTCDIGQSVSGITLKGNIAVGSSASDNQSQSFTNEEPGTEQLIFRRTFNYRPDYIQMTGLEPDSPAPACGFGFLATQPQTATLNISDLALDVQQSVDMIGDNPEKLQLLVTISKTGLQPGSIRSDQIVCDLDDPALIENNEEAFGVTGFSYFWQYALSESGPWLAVEGDPAGNSYDPPSLDNTTWFRRGAEYQGQKVYTEPVKITITEFSEPGYILQVALNEYRCSNQDTDIVLGVTLNVDGTLIDAGSLPVSAGGDEAMIIHEFSEIPQQLILNTTGDLLGETGASDCDGIFLDAQEINQIVDVSFPYTVVRGDEALDYTITILPSNGVLSPGSIGDNQIVCKDEMFLALTGTTPTIDGDFRYNWQASTNGGFTWEDTGITTKDYPGTTISETTRFRREVWQGCAVGRSNVVVITVPKLNVNILGLAPEYAPGASAVTLTGVPSGGTFSGPGMTGNIFDPQQVQAGVVITITYTITDEHGCIHSAEANTIVRVPPLCSTRVPLSGSGAFILDKFSGQVVYQKADDCSEDIALNCITGVPQTPVMDKVITANATTLADDWDYRPYYKENYVTTDADANLFESGIQGKWRVKSGYAYRTNEIFRDKNYNTSTFDLAVFNWQYENANKTDEWILSTDVVKYSPQGEGLEEYNAIGIASAVKMGYSNSVPYLTAQNAIYEAVFFESFENDPDKDLESSAMLSGGSVNTSSAHAGHQSLSLMSGQSITTPLMKVASEQTAMMAQIWVKGNGEEQLNTRMTDSETNGEIASSLMTQVARSGDWGLYQVILNPGSTTGFEIEITQAGAGTVLLDDMRIQPVEAEMTCYVYDQSTLRLLTIFDSQHFGLYYQYDGEGKLVRKTIETERGIRTLEETFYNRPKVNLGGE